MKWNDEALNTGARLYAPAAGRRMRLSWRTYPPNLALGYPACVILYCFMFGLIVWLTIKTSYVIFNFNEWNLVSRYVWCGRISLNDQRMLKRNASSLAFSNESSSKDHTLFLFFRGRYFFHGYHMGISKQESYGMSKISDRRLAEINYYRKLNTQMVLFALPFFIFFMVFHYHNKNYKEARRYRTHALKLDKYIFNRGLSRPMINFFKKK